MTGTAARNISDRDLDPGIQAGRVALVYRAIPLSLFTVLVIACALAAVLWPVVAHSRILGWLAATLLLSVLRLGHYRSFRSATRRGDRHWRLAATIGAWASGGLWGSVSLLLFAPGDFPHQVFLALCVAGMAAGAVTTLSALFPAIAGFLCLALLPLAVRFAEAGHHLATVAALLTVLFLVMLLAASLRLHLTISDTLRERFERQRAEHSARLQALYDDLTGLPNRRLFMDRLERELARALRHDEPGAVLFLDLDNFKHVNDSLGHATGDALLAAVANRIQERVRVEDTAARLGGDEFVVLLSQVGVTCEQLVASTQGFAADLQRALDRPYHIGHNELHLSASIGIALFPDDGRTPEEVLRHADVAMYRAKEMGRDMVQFFLPNMQEAAHRRLTLLRGLRSALDRDELVLVYQPQVDRQGQLVGAEALLRWHHPERGLVYPGEFMALAEDSGTIVPVGRRIMQLACRDLARVARVRPLPLAINVSPRQFGQIDLVTHIQHCLAEQGADPGLLHLEITESSMMHDIGAAVSKMRELRRLGVGFAIDDFGTGHSSLAQLKRLPVDTLKIDQSFVRDIVVDADDATIVETILVMARHLGIEVVAEGVETREAYEFLLAQDCRCFQGYLFSRPLSLEALLELLETRVSLLPHGMESNDRNSAIP